MIFRQYEIQDNIYTWHQDYGFNGTGWQYQVLATSAAATYGASNLVTAVDDTNITFGAAVTRDQIIYAWSEIPGYSAFGTYTGNGDPNGPFVYTGHRSALILIKSFTTEDNWFVWDTTRDINNPARTPLSPNLPDDEDASDNNSVDILSNGFKIRTLRNGINGVGRQFVWASFAENPFGSSNTSPANAR